MSITVSNLRVQLDCLHQFLFENYYCESGTDTVNLHHIWSICSEPHWFRSSLLSNQAIVTKHSCFYFCTHFELFSPSITSLFSPWTPVNKFGFSLVLSTFISGKSYVVTVFHTISSQYMLIFRSLLMVFLVITWYVLVQVVLLVYPFLWLNLYLHLFKQRRSKIGKQHHKKKKIWRSEVPIFCFSISSQ